jgi:hypothetical protein
MTINTAAIAAATATATATSGGNCFFALSLFY